MEQAILLRMAAEVVRLQTSPWGSFLQFANDAVIAGDGRVLLKVPTRLTATVDDVPGYTTYGSPAGAPTVVNYHETAKVFAPYRRVSVRHESDWSRQAVGAHEITSNALSPYIKAVSEAAVSEFHRQAKLQVSNFFPIDGTPQSIAALDVTAVDGMNTYAHQLGFPNVALANPMDRWHAWINSTLKAKLATFEDFKAANIRGDGPSEQIIAGMLPYTYGFQWVLEPNYVMTHVAGTGTSPGTTSADIPQYGQTMGIAGLGAGGTLKAGDLILINGPTDTQHVIVNPDIEKPASEYTYTADGAGAIASVRFEPGVPALVSSGAQVDLIGDHDYALIHHRKAYAAVMMGYGNAGITTYQVIDAVDVGTDEQPGSGLSFSLIRGDDRAHLSFVDVAAIAGLRVWQHEYAFRWLLTT
jgi:hypothetical protein